MLWRKAWLNVLENLIGEKRNWKTEKNYKKLPSYLQVKFSSHILRNEKKKTNEVGGGGKRSSHKILQNLSLLCFVIRDFVRMQMFSFFKASISKWKCTQTQHFTGQGTFSCFGYDTDSSEETRWTPYSILTAPKLHFLLKKK